MTLKQRLTALEHGPTELLTVFANVPAKWSASEAAQAIKTEALAQGYQTPFLTFPMHQEGADGVAIVGSERMGDLIDYVAENGRRIGGESM